MLMVWEPMRKNPKINQKGFWKEQKREHAIVEQDKSSDIEQQPPFGALKTEIKQYTTSKWM